MVAPKLLLRVREYRISLDVDFHAMTWTGTIDFDVEGSAPNVDLDGLRLAVQRATVGGSPVEVEIDPAEERIRLKRAVSGSAPVHVEFSGAVAEHSLMGLYRSRYGSSYILTSQCEAAAAREIFPCIDRPDVKAKVHLTVRADSGLEVISNMPPASVVEEGTRRRWTFAETPPMATYLFYLGLGSFEVLPGDAGKVAMRVLTPPGRSSEGRTALEVTRVALEELEKYYRLPYPLPKLDLIAVPEFPAGAMENWGAITFRDMQLLISDKTPSFEMRYTVATIVHEVAHQWFGNLVTPYWWTDIWLNESFATFVEHQVVERRFPELKSEQDFLSLWTRWGFLLDSGPTSHPIVVEVNHASEVGQAIDRLTYGKGAAVLRMIEGYLGSERFEAGVADYLQRHAGGNASSGDLWSALDRASGEPITRVLRPWIERAGHPVIDARQTPEGIRLTQRRFGYLPQPNTELWPIPMVLEIDGKRERRLFETSETLVPAPPNAVVHLNSGALGFYRTRYDAALSERLLAGFERRSPADRWIVLEDLWAFLLSGDSDLATFSRFAHALGSATDYLSVGATAAHLETLLLWAGDNPAVARLARDFVVAPYERLGLTPKPGEDSTDGSLRETVTRVRVLSDPVFARELAREFPRWDQLDANVRLAVAIARTSTGGREGYEEVLAALKKATSEGETLRFELALVRSNDPALVGQTLAMALSGEVNKGHLGVLLLSAAANPVARNVTWAWLEQHFPEVQERLHGTTLLTDFLDLGIPTLGLSQPERVRAYFRDHPFPGDAKGIARGLAMLEVAEGVVRRISSEVGDGRK